MWTQDSLWRKAVSYYRWAADSNDPENEFSPLFFTISLELLARAALAHRSPALLADPREGDDHLLVSLGLLDKPARGSPRSRDAKGVVLLCQRLLVPSLTKEDVENALLLIDSRNTELHSGAWGFADLNESTWMPRYYKAVKALCESQGKALKDFVGEEYEQAEKMILAVLADRRAEASAAIRSAREEFDALPPAERAARLTEPKEWEAKHRWHFGGLHSRKIPCPACKGQCFITGEVMRESQPRLVDHDLFIEQKILPTGLRCKCCSLDLKGYELLHSVGLGNPYTCNAGVDPIEHFGITAEQFRDGDPYDDGR